MSNNYTPNQSVTVIDAKGVRGPGRIERRESGPLGFRVLFPHTTDSGNVFLSGECWLLSPDPKSDQGIGLTILPEPFTEPKGEFQCRECGGELGHYPRCPESQSSKGDSDKPLTAEELDEIERELGIWSALSVTETSPFGKRVRRLLSMARSSLAGEVRAPDALSSASPPAKDGSQ